MEGNDWFRLTAVENSIATNFVWPESGQRPDSRGSKRLRPITQNHGILTKEINDSRNRKVIFQWDHTGKRARLVTSSHCLHGTDNRRKKEKLETKRHAQSSSLAQTMVWLIVASALAVLGFLALGEMIACLQGSLFLELAVKRKGAIAEKEYEPEWNKVGWGYDYVVFLQP